MSKKKKSKFLKSKGFLMLIALFIFLLILTFFFGALLLGFGKRRAEINEYKREAYNFRVVNLKYTRSLLDQIITILGGNIIIFYTLYVVMGTGTRFGNWMVLTIIFVVYGVFRYFMLLRELNIAASPTEIVLLDKAIAIDIVLWIICCVVIMY